jgi:hypothetical protein
VAAPGWRILVPFGCVNKATTRPLCRRGRCSASGPAVRPCGPSSSAGSCRAAYKITRIPLARAVKATARSKRRAARLESEPCATYSSRGTGLLGGRVPPHIYSAPTDRAGPPPFGTLRAGSSRGRQQKALRARRQPQSEMTKILLPLSGIRMTGCGTWDDSGRRGGSPRRRRKQY